jgi:hypothetical protein
VLQQWQPQSTADEVTAYLIVLLVSYFVSPVSPASLHLQLFVFSEFT